MARPTNGARRSKDPSAMAANGQRNASSSDDGLIHALGHDLPPVSSFSSDAASGASDPERRRRTADGDNVVKRASNNANPQLCENAATGKLKLPSSDVQYRLLPSIRPTGRQRQIGQPSRGRPDPYSLDVSPEKMPPLPRRNLQPPLQISPTREQRKQRSRAAEQPEISTAGRILRDDQAVNSTAHSASSKPYPKPNLQRRSREVAKLLLAMDAENEDTIVVAQSSDPAAPTDDEQDANIAPQRRKPGRPKKTASHVPLISVERESVAATPRRGRGRPRKEPILSDSSIQANDSPWLRERFQNLPRTSKVAEPGGKPHGNLSSPDGIADPIDQDDAPSSPQVVFPATSGNDPPAAEEAEGQNSNGVADENPNDSQPQSQGDLEDAGEEERVRPLPIRISQVFPSNSQSEPAAASSRADADVDNGDDHNAGTEAATVVSKKRKRTEDPQPTSTRPKKTKISGHPKNNAQGHPATPVVAPRNPARLLGQWHALQKVFSNVSKIGVNIKEGEPQRPNEIELRDKSIRQISRLCQNLASRLASLKDDSDAVNGDAVDHVTDLDRIKRKVGRLYDDKTTDFTDLTRSIDIHANLLPTLVKLLRSLLACYENIDQGKVTDELAVSGEHLNTLRALIRTIVLLGQRAQDFVRPPAELAIIQSNQRYVIEPLHRIERSFNAHLSAQEAARRRARENAEAQAHQAILAQREEVAALEKAEVNRREEKWARLHEEREEVEYDRFSKSKIMHLRRPDLAPDPVIELDANGEPFERLQIFAPRVLRPPGAAQQVVWSIEELSALQAGLIEYKGEKVFEKIFRQYCGRGGILSKYNVTQIVTAAAGLKSLLEVRQQQRYGKVAEWVKVIPMWTKPVSRGQENMDVV